MLKSTRYNSSFRGTHSDPKYLNLRPYIETYEFEILDNVEPKYFSIHIGPEQAKRLVKNLIIALRHNGHWGNGSNIIAEAEIEYLKNLNPSKKEI